MILDSIVELGDHNNMGARLTNWLFNKDSYGVVMVKVFKGDGTGINGRIVRESDTNKA